MAWADELESYALVGSVLVALGLGYLWARRRKAPSLPIVVGGKTDVIRAIPPKGGKQ